MYYYTYYTSPVGSIKIVCDEEKLVGLFIEGQAGYRQKYVHEAVLDNNYSAIVKSREWLDKYFAGKKPAIEELNLSLQGSDFQKRVWRLLKEIPYGETTTYGILAKRVAEEMGKETMSAQAVGSAVGRNPISIIIPCHRVIGSDGSLTGYDGGIEKKVYLLDIEKRTK